MYPSAIYDIADDGNSTQHSVKRCVSDQKVIISFQIIIMPFTLQSLPHGRVTLKKLVEHDQSCTSWNDRMEFWGKINGR